MVNNTHERKIAIWLARGPNEFERTLAEHSKNIKSNVAVTRVCVSPFLIDVVFAY